jgi:hypothetical protein
MFDTIILSNKVVEKRLNNHVNMTDSLILARHCKQHNWRVIMRIPIVNIKKYISTGQAW